MELKGLSSFPLEREGGEEERGGRGEREREREGRGELSRCENLE